MSGPLTLIAKLTATPEAAAMLGDGLAALIAPTRAEPGCLEYRLHRHMDDPRTWILYETWRSRSDLDRHFEQPYTAELMARFPTLLAGPMDLTFCTAIA